MNTRPVTGIVLAAGGSSRLGTPKQLLPLGDNTVLGASVDVARACSFDQIIVTLGAAAAAVLDAVALGDVDVVIVGDYGSGCSSSLRAALGSIDPHATGIVLMLGDQPGLAPGAVRRLIAEKGSAPIAVCRYTDGIGHPFWFSTDVFGALVGLHGDKGVWQIIESGRIVVREVVVDGAVPLDVDTWDDYQRLLASVTP
ncbi:nucleotidyltransferase family protein [Mycobacterium sp.]|jgi:molybdenum cofactor cytidylyltransferase|uniref:nucleotidyltransferase family protein n=1 Tax=Mycobacterium sp. TaxID=1785 RepID=UPI002D457337|nr:nucleotidyltransferase family protein [Mycobacterium sp.]HZA09528.1 nucleotidyltransferase family protein [Mycobacterium sp.]